MVNHFYGRTYKRIINKFKGNIVLESMPLTVDDKETIRKYKEL